MKQLLTLIFIFFGFTVFGQPDNTVITPENSRAKRKEQHDLIETEYLQRVEKHQDAQGKKGKKRMRKNLKKSQRLRRLGNMPWYKRMWVRRQ